ncbi:MAG TPA: CBS domain-containing protein, partial [Rudaea sp.]|nr:CBS domain-containing protein [Rudaea sp.]
MIEVNIAADPARQNSCKWLRETTMRIAEVCSRRVVCVDPKASAKDAAEAMHHQDVGALVVVRADKRKPAGILTDRD